MPTERAILYYPVGPDELESIKQSGWIQLPAPPDGEYFYPVPNPHYAGLIAQEAHVDSEGAGYVTKFAIAAEYLRNFDLRRVDAPWQQAYWIPVKDLDEFNRHTVGPIEVVREFRADEQLEFDYWSRPVARSIALFSA